MPITIDLPDDLERQDSGIQFGNYGNQWASEVMGDKNAIPSLNEVIDGLSSWYSHQLEDRMKNWSE